MRLATGAVFLSFAGAPACGQTPAMDGPDVIVVLGQAQRNLSFEAPAPTASRLDAPLFDLPAGVDRIDQNEMIVRGRSSVVDALNGARSLILLSQKLSQSVAYKGGFGPEPCLLRS